MLSGPDQLSQIYVRSALGGVVPLSAIARFEIGPAPLSITHQGQFPAMTISFNLAPDKSLGQAVQAIQAALRADRHAGQRARRLQGDGAGVHARRSTASRG